MTGHAFRFRLERVRAVRERAEKLAKQDLAEAISRRSSTEQELRATEANIAQALENMMPIEHSARRVTRCAQWRGLVAR